MSAYLIVFGDSQNDYPPLTHTGTIRSANREAKKQAKAIGAIAYDIKRQYDGRWERLSDVGDYDPNRGAPIHRH